MHRLLTFLVCRGLKYADSLICHDHNGKACSSADSERLTSGWRKKGDPITCRYCGRPGIATGEFGWMEEFVTNDQLRDRRIPRARLVAREVRNAASNRSAHPLVASHRHPLLAQLFNLLTKGPRVSRRF